MLAYIELVGMLKELISIGVVHRVAARPRPVRLERLQDLVYYVQNLAK